MLWLAAYRIICQKSYHGEAWKKQVVPGKIECERYDKGGSPMTDSLTAIYLKKGLHLLTLHVIEHGNMNFDYLEFIKQPAGSVIF